MKIIKSKKNQEILLFIVLISLASFLRFYQMPLNMPLISDQAKDFFVAKDFVTEGKIPLLGIESSMPQFRQGPIYNWLLALVFLLFGFSPENTAYLSASIGIMAVGALYIWGRKYFGRKVAFFASSILAVSPMAVAHSQLSFIINPIPLVSVIYLISLIKYSQKKSMSLLWPAFFFGLLFQFELASFPLILLLPIAFKLKERKIDFKKISLGVKGLLLGIAPQIIYDITHSFKQLGLFGIWVGYRIAAFLGYKKDHSFSFKRLVDTLSIFKEYLHKFISWDNNYIFIFFIVVIFIGLIIWLKKPYKFTYPITFVWMWIGILGLSYVIHGSPSEAYFPAFFVPISLSIGWTLSQAKGKIANTLSVLIIGSLIAFNTLLLLSSNILSKPLKNSIYSTAIWLPRYKDQLEVIDIIKSNTQSPVRLRSIGPGSQFPAFLDNYRYLLILDGVKLSDQGDSVWIVTGEERDNPQFINTKLYKLDYLTVSVPL